MNIYSVKKAWDKTIFNLSKLNSINLDIIKKEDLGVYRLIEFSKDSSRIVKDSTIKLECYVDEFLNIKYGTLYNLVPHVAASPGIYYTRANYDYARNKYFWLNKKESSYFLDLSCYNNTWILLNI